MRTSVAVGASVVLLVSLAAAGAAVARPHASALEVAARLNPAQEVPTPKGDVSAARGTFSATVTRSGTSNVMAWELTFSGLTGPAGAAHVHLGARGQSGGVVVPLCGPCQSPASGTANVEATVLDALQTGGAYANVHTPTNPPGEIRGQIGVVAEVTTALTARQEVPKPKGRVNRARGTFTAVVTSSGTNTRIGWRLVFSGLTGKALAAHIHLGARGKAGPVALALCGPCRSGMRRSAALSPALVAALEAGRAYVNVHTARNQAGEVRGQIGAVALRITG